MTPHCLMTSSKTRSSPAREPVCDAAACAPRSDLPALITMTGFFLVAVLRTVTSSWPALIPSMYIRITFDNLSRSRYSSKPASVTSDLFPTEMIAETPMFSTFVLPIIATPMAPL